MCSTAVLLSRSILPYAAQGRWEKLPRPYEMPYSICGPISGSDGRGPSRGGGPGPCGRWRYAYAYGTRAPWSAGASWADRYEPCWDTSCTKIKRVAPPTTTASRLRSSNKTALHHLDLNDAHGIIAYFKIACQPLFWFLFWFFYALWGGIPYIVFRNKKSPMN